jgi:hypothetical protein
VDSAVTQRSGLGSSVADAGFTPGALTEPQGDAEAVDALLEQPASR